MCVRDDGIYLCEVLGDWFYICCSFKSLSKGGIVYWVFIFLLGFIFIVIVGFCFLMFGVS